MNILPKMYLRLTKIPQNFWSHSRPNPDPGLGMFMNGFQRCKIGHFSQLDMVLTYLSWHCSLSQTKVEIVNLEVWSWERCPSLCLLKHRLILRLDVRSAICNRCTALMSRKTSTRTVVYENTSRRRWKKSPVDWPASWHWYFFWTVWIIFLRTSPPRACPGCRTRGRNTSTWCWRPTAATSCRYVLWTSTSTTSRTGGICITSSTNASSESILLTSTSVIAWSKTKDMTDSASWPLYNMRWTLLNSATYKCSYGNSCYRAQIVHHSGQISGQNSHVVGFGYDSSDTEMLRKFDCNQWHLISNVTDNIKILNNKTATSFIKVDKPSL